MRKCALAVVINSGSAEHKAEGWLANKERVRILPPVAVSARSYYKNKAVLCGYFSAGKKKIPTQKPVIWHSSVLLALSNHKRPAIEKRVIPGQHWNTVERSAKLWQKKARI